MTTLPPLERLQELNPQPGSLLVATVPSRTTMEQADALLQEMHRAVPDVKVLVVTSGMGVTVAGDAERAWLVVAMLANGPEPTLHTLGSGRLPECVLCGRSAATPSSRPLHTEDCPWRQAVALLEAER